MAIDAADFPGHFQVALQHMAGALDQFQFRYALIGGLAAGYRSRPRFTQDLDILLEIPQIRLPPFLDDLCQRGFTFDRDTVIRQWTQEHVTSMAYHGIRLDWLKPVIPLYQHVIDLARPEKWLGGAIRIASAEGILLTKLVAFRGQDQIDIHDLLIANRGQLDLDLIRREWQTVAGLDAPQMQQFEDMVARYYLAPP
jgi:hypothetical protein